MIDFAKSPVFKLSKTTMDANCNADDIEKILIADERVLHIFASYRDAVVFTTRRIIAINVQGLSGKKKDFTFLPYSKIQAYSVETAGTFDRDAEMELYFSGLGKVKFEFTAGTNVGDLSRLISTFVLK